MAVHRPQFRLSTLFWLTLAVACFLAGREYHRRWETPPPPSILQEWIINGVPESSLPHADAVDSPANQTD
jgi:hypothetical protein